MLRLECAAFVLWKWQKKEKKEFSQLIFELQVSKLSMQTKQEKKENHFLTGQL